MCLFIKKVTKMIIFLKDNKISFYNEKAEHHINNLISSMNNSVKQITSWWDYFIRVK